jgi:hypothetical protein
MSAFMDIARGPVILLGALLAGSCGASAPAPPVVPTQPVLASPSPSPVLCQPLANPYAKSIVDLFLRACSRRQNNYNEPEAVLGPPDAVALGPKDEYTGILSLGQDGYVTVDMGGCAADRPGPDLRVYQVAGSEPVTVYASTSPTGPFVPLERDQVCGTRMPGSQIIRYCDFDLAVGGLPEARYFRIEDGEHYPCPGDTATEGADIDAVQVLNPR